MFKGDHHLNYILKELIHNHPQPIHRTDIQRELNITKKDLIYLLTKLKKELRKIDLLVIGINKNNVIPFEECEKIFLILRDVKKNSKKFREMNNLHKEEYKKMIIVFSLILIEGTVFKGKLLFLLKNICDEQFLNKLRYSHYIHFSRSREDVEEVVELGWRFKAEFSSLNPLKCVEEFKEFKKSSKKISKEEEIV